MAPRAAVSAARGLAARALAGARPATRARWAPVRAFSERPLDVPNVRDLAQLARIEIPESELASVDRDVRGLVAWFGRLGTPPSGGTPPGPRPMTLSDLRADVAVEFPDREGILRQVPVREGDFVLVPKIATEADKH